MAILVGTSGYVYPDWKGRFYPPNLPQTEWLEFYAKHFKGVELNVTFYRLPASATFLRWRTCTPADFQFVLKGSRLITHFKRLRDCHELLVELVERAAELGEKLSCLLWQLPANFPYDPDRLKNFLNAVEQVQSIYGKFRQAIEFRDQSWFTTPVYAVLKQFHVAIVLADWPFNLWVNDTDSDGTGLEYEADRPRLDVPMTANFLYVRRHGPGTRYASAYTEEEVADLARALQYHLKKGRDGYVFFNNDVHAYAIENARQLIKNLQNI